MIKGEGGWSYLEFIIALMILSLLIIIVYPLFTVFKAAHVEKRTHLQALWLGQEAVERQMAVRLEEREAEGGETVHIKRDEYEVSWRRERLETELDRVEVKVRWQVGDSPRELHLERYIASQ